MLEGKLARIHLLSLYRMHQMALLRRPRTLLLDFSATANRPQAPKPAPQSCQLSLFVRSYSATASRAKVAASARPY